MIYSVGHMIYSVDHMIYSVDHMIRVDKGRWVEQMCSVYCHW